MKKEERLKIYIAALKDWKDNNEFTDHGFCKYFYRMFNIDVFEIITFQNTFPEIFIQKNKYSFDEFNKLIKPSSLTPIYFWKIAYTNKDKKRISVLKKAIKLNKIMS